MTEIIKFDTYKKKLQGICDENNLLYKLECDTYPITLTIQPLEGLDEQSLFEEDDETEPANSPDAPIMFFFQDGTMVYRMSERFTINDNLFAKIKNLFRNLHYTWLQFFHREVIEKRLVQSGLMPLPDDYDQSMFPQPADDEPGDGDSE